MSALNIHNPRRHAAQQQGFTLLEILIALVIFSVGLLGIAGLQMTGMKQTHNSHLRSVATTQVMDLADRMRANMAGVEANNYGDYASYAMDYSACTTDCATCTPRDCANLECNAAELAEYDMCEWTMETVAALPGGAAHVCLDDTPAPASAATDWSTGTTSLVWGCSDTGNVHAVKIQWTERTLDNENQNAARTNFRHFFMRVSP